MHDREKKLILPEAKEEIIGQPDCQALPQRPDLQANPFEQQDEDSLADWYSIGYEPCPCCGADIPANPSWGYICPVCLWEIDYSEDVANDPTMPSDQNHGLSLEEAQLNFRVFGICDPWLRWKDDPSAAEDQPE